MPAVTIGLPFHRERGSLADAIRSVFAQTFTDWELILVDDGSTDGSLDVAKAVRDPRVRVLSDGRNRKLPARLNQIVDEAKSDLIARLDADDMIYPDRLERQLEVLAERPTLDLVGSAILTIDASQAMKIRCEEAGRPEPIQVLRRGLIAHATVIARRTWLQANRYDERYPRAEDRELFTRTCQSVRLKSLPEPLYFVFDRKDEATVLDDYVGSCRDSRRLFARFGGVYGVPLIAESLAKEVVFRAFTAAGQQERLVRRRGRALTKEEREQAEAAMRRIRETKIPGLD